MGKELQRSQDTHASGPSHSLPAIPLVESTSKTSPKRQDKSLKKVLHSVSPGLVVDIGCGDGSRLRSLPEDYRPVGIEISQTLAREKQRLPFLPEAALSSMPPLLMAFLNLRPTQRRAYSCALSWSTNTIPVIFSFNRRGFFSPRSRDYKSPKLLLLKQKSVRLQVVRVPLSWTFELFYSRKSKGYGGIDRPDGEQFWFSRPFSFW